MIRLGVNIDHIATLREVRKSKYPDLLQACRLIQKAGGNQITVHLREDRRHIQDADVVNLRKKISLPLNLEMAFIPEMVKLALKWKPFSVTLVPERRAEMTTESGIDLRKTKKKLELWKQLRREKKIKIHAFIDADLEQVHLARSMGFDGIEFHTGPYAHSPDRKELKKLFRAASLADALGLEVKAGHGLTVANVRALKKMPGLSEVNIGHSIVSRAVFVGLKEAIREMKRAL